MLRLVTIDEYVDDENKFKDEQSQMKAIFLLKYLVYGDELEFQEPELFLNRILVGLDINVPLPKICKLTDAEINLANSMLIGVKAQWDKMTNTSLESFRVSFLQRAGQLSMNNENIWRLGVEEQAFDVLIDFIPWGFKMIKAT